MPTRPNHALRRQLQPANTVGSRRIVRAANVGYRKAAFRQATALLRFLQANAWAPSAPMPRHLRRQGGWR